MTILWLPIVTRGDGEGDWMRVFRAGSALSPRLRCPRPRAAASLNAFYLDWGVGVDYFNGSGSGNGRCNGGVGTRMSSAASGRPVDWQALTWSSRDHAAEKGVMSAKLLNGTYFSAVVPELTARVVLAPEDLEKGYYNLADTGAIFDLALEELISGSGHPVETAADFVAVGGSCGMSHTLVGLAVLLSQSVPTPGVSTRLAPTVHLVERALAGIRTETEAEAAEIDGESGISFKLRNPNNERHMRALLALSQHDPIGACATWENAVLANPWDILALFCMQETYLRCGNAHAALSCVERVLGCWDTNTPNYSRLLSLHATGLFECGFVNEAEETAGRALAISTDNVRATRATARGLHRLGRFREGLRLLRELDETYEDAFDGASVSHLSHELDAMRCAFHVETGKINNALAVIDSRFLDFIGTNNDSGHQQQQQQQEEDSAEVFPPFVSTASALWRLYVAGVDDGYFRTQMQEREVLSKSWNIFATSGTKIQAAAAAAAEGQINEAESLTSRFQRTLSLVLDGFESVNDNNYSTNESGMHGLKLSEREFLSPEPLVPMIDVYKVIVLVGAGELAKAQSLVNAMQVSEHNMKDKEKNVCKQEPAVFQDGPSFAPSRSSSLPLASRLSTSTKVCEALLLLGAGDAAAACDVLMSVRSGFVRLGGTFDHIDLLEQTLCMASLRAAQVRTEFIATSTVNENVTNCAQTQLRLWTARSLVYERTQRQSLSPQSWDWRARVQHALGQPQLAECSQLRASDLGFRQGGSNQH